jgi:hypothetical protein
VFVRTALESKSGEEGFSDEKAEPVSWDPAFLSSHGAFDLSKGNTLATKARLAVCLFSSWPRAGS